MFDLNNKFRKPANVKTHSSSLQFELINLGTDAEPKYVNLGKCCSPGERSKFISLFKQYKDVFAWTYEEMKLMTQGLYNFSSRLKLVSILTNSL